jgi:hypothetical protein
MGMLCGKRYTGKWALYHHVEKSHSREVLDDLEQANSVIHCRYCDDNKPINDSFFLSLPLFFIIITIRTVYESI